MNLRYLLNGHPRQWTDTDLLRAFRTSGQDAYFDVLFERYYPLVYTLCLSVTTDREDSKDVTLIVFTKIHSLLRHETPDQFDAWLMTLARRECINLLRTNQRRAENEKKWYDWENSGENFMENEAFRRLIYEADKEREQQFQAALDALPDAQRRCLLFFVYELKSYQEIADITEYPLPQVKSHIQNARRRLKIQLTNTDGPDKQ